MSDETPDPRRQTCHGCLGLGFVRGILGVTPCAVCNGRGTVLAHCRHPVTEPYTGGYLRCIDCRAFFKVPA